MTLFDRLISWLYIRHIWGSRCLDYDPACETCKRWREHDWMFNGARNDTP